jgi:LCP family protein required for cell wall assembly
METVPANPPQYTAAVPTSDPTSRGVRPAANEDGLLALGAAIDRGVPTRVRRSSHRRRTRSTRVIWMRRGFVAVASIVVLAIAAFVANYFYLGTLAHRIKLDYLQTNGNGVNILLVGSTDRCAFKKQNPQYGLCENGVNGVNSDIVMIAHLQNGKASLLSIPRDLFVPNARSCSAQFPCTNGPNANKIDAALFDGPSQLAVAIEEDFGIKINHFIELNFQTFANVVSTVGGINMYFPMRVYDAESSLNIERPGCYHLDGVKALQVVRARHLQIGYPRDGNDPRNWPLEVQSDLARIRRTHEFLRLVASKIASMGISNFSADESLALEILPNLTVDSGFGWRSMATLAVDYAGTNISAVPQYTYPVVLNQADPQNADSYQYQGYFYGDVEFPVQPGGWLSIDQLFGAKADQSPWNDRTLPAPGTFPISVENGTSLSHEGATTAAQLRGKGFRITATGDRTPYGPTSETVIWYGGPPPPKSGNWKNPDQADAMRVMSQLEGPVVLGYDPAEVTRGDVVTVLTGTALSVATRNWTAPPNTTTTLHGTTTTGTVRKPPVTATTVLDPPGIRANNSLSAPTDLAQPLMPWDPRACSAGMKVIFHDPGI